MQTRRNTSKSVALPARTWDQWLDAEEQIGHIDGRRFPDLILVHSIIPVDKSVAHPRNQRPRNLWMTASQLAREPLHCLSYYRQLMQHSRSRLQIALENRPIDTCINSMIS
jgi:hypothetical protein